ncbi:MAG: sigma-70 family RNA polymerase sigma factor [Eubacteriales bacterium]|nr:sigma-70 family RNA polymerase sigma factor [Eubacteriales bacterium]
MQDSNMEKLIEQAKGRDPDAFAELMQRQMKSMYRVALAILMNDEDTADAIQDAILACWEKMHTLRKPEYFRTWLTRILINKCYDIRKRRGAVRDPEPYPEPSACDEYNLELKEALGSLDEKYRVAITLFYGGGYRTDEIARLLKIPRSTVQTRLQRGRAKLAEYYGR